MLDRFIQALLQEIVKILIKHPTFFSKNATEKKKLLEEFRIPSSIKDYLTEVNKIDFIADTRQFVEYTKNRNLNLDTNKLLISIAEFLVDSFTNDLYALPIDYFKLNYEDQKQIVNELITSTTILGETLREILVNNSSQEISNNIQQFLQATINCPMVIVQSPVEIESEAKKEMKTRLTKDLGKPCFPIFQVNRQLIGGLRIFVNGKVEDLSWIKNINFITSLK